MNILSIGLQEAAMSLLGKVFSKEEIYELPCEPEKLMDPQNVAVPAMVLIGPPPEGTAVIEVAQIMRMHYQDIPIMYLTSERLGFDKQLLVKNGFTDIFLLPIDAPTLEERLRDELSKATSGGKKSFKPVKLLDLAPGVTLDFDTLIYMPMNKKHIRLSNSGDELDPVLVEKLKKQQISSLYVEQSQMSKFYDFTARQLKNLGKNPQISATEKAAKMKDAVRSLMGGIFNDSAGEGTIGHGREVINDCQQIVKSYIMNGAVGKSDWYERMMTTAGGGNGVYNHAGNVATFAALFSMGLGAGDTEQLAIAGLLHDIGIADLPHELQNKNSDQITAAESEVYYKHVEHSVAMIRDRKLIVSELVTKIILQHHEHFDGSGFPKGLTGQRICKEAQILALADRFDELTTSRDGQSRMKPIEAIQFLRDQATNNPSKIIFDPDLLKGVLALFPV